MAAGRAPLSRFGLFAVVALLLAVWVEPLSAATTTLTGPWIGGTISAGNRVVLNNGAAVMGNVVVDGTFQFNQTGALTLSSTLSGTGTLSLTNTGTLTLLATNTNAETVLSNKTSLASGRLNIGNSGTGQINLQNALSITGGFLASGNAILASSPGGIVPLPAGIIYPTKPSRGSATISTGSWVNAENLVVGASANEYSVLEINDKGRVVVGGTISTGTYKYNTGSSYQVYDYILGRWVSYPIVTITTGSIALLSGGTLQIGMGGTTGVLSPTAFTTDGTLAFNRSDAATYAGAISGSGGVVQMGSGTMTLSGNNSYTGPTRVSAGLLVLSGSNSSPLNVVSGTVRLASRFAIPNVNKSAWSPGNLVVGPQATLSLDTGAFSDADASFLASNGTGTSGFMDGSFLALDTSRASGGIFKLTGPIANTNSGSNGLGLVKTGSGTLVLLGSNSYAGGTYIQSGTLQIEGSFSLPGSVVNNGVLQNACSGTVTWGGVISGSGALINRGDRLILTGSNTYTGPTLNYRELRLPFRHALYGGNTSQWTAANLTTGSNATLRISVGGTGGFTASDVDVLKNLGTGTTGFLDGSILNLDTTNAASGTFVYAGSLANTNGGAARLNFSKSGSGTLVLTGENTTTGWISASGGILQIGNGGTTGSVAGAISGAIVFNRSNASVCPGDVFASGNSGTAAFTKLGNGVLTLTGSTQCRGDFVVAQGSIDVRGDGTVNLPTASTGIAAYIGRGAESTATLSLKDGTLLSYVTFIGSDGGRGTLNMASGTLAADGSDSRGVRDWAGVYINDGEMNVSGGYVRGWVYVRDPGGRLNVSGGNLDAGVSASQGSVVIRGGTCRGSVFLGRSGYASLAISGGLVESATTAIGDWSTGTGVATITSGTHISTNLRVGDLGVGRVTMTGGSVASGSAVIGSGTSSLGQWTLAGGTWSNIGNLVVGGSGTGLLTIGGGTSGDAVLIVGQQMRRGAKGTIALHPGGSLQIGTGGTTGDLVTDLSNNGLLIFDRSNTSTYSGVVSGSGNVSKRGSGTLTLAGPNTLTGPTTIQQGTLQLAHASALSASTISPLAGGTLSLSPSLQTAVGGLEPNAGGLIDIGTGEITVASGLSVAGLATALQTGRGDGSWNGPAGITSSAVAASNGSRTVGWLDNGDGSVTFGYAAAGDTNLDWSVDILDISRMLSGGKFNSDMSATWAEGDFTYDGVADILDISRFISSGLFNTGPYNTPAGTIAAVPEPSALGLLGVGVGVIGLMAARRKRAA